MNVCLSVWVRGSRVGLGSKSSRWAGEWVGGLVGWWARTGFGGGLGGGKGQTRTCHRNDVRDKAIIP